MLKLKLFRYKCCLTFFHLLIYRSTTCKKSEKMLKNMEKNIGFIMNFKNGKIRSILSREYTDGYRSTT